MKKYITPGLVLILAGLYFLLDALPGISIPSGCLLLFVGAGLLIGRICTRRYGLSIAGFIVLCLGAGFFLRDLLHLDGRYTVIITPLSLSLAFFLIHIFEYRRIGNWPMIPALILLLIGGLCLITMEPTVYALVKPYFGAIIPAILILVGILLLVRGAANAHRNKTAPHVTYTQGSGSNVPPADTASWAQPPLHSEPEQPAPQDPAAEPETLVTDSVPHDAADAAEPNKEKTEDIQS